MSAALRELVASHGGRVPTYVAERTVGRVTPQMRRAAGVRRVLDMLVLPPGSVPTTAPPRPVPPEPGKAEADGALPSGSTAGPRGVAPNVVPGRPVVSRAGGNALATPKGRAKAIATTRAKGDATRAKILAALVKAGTKGLVAQQLAKAAGVSLAGVSRHRAAMGDLVVRDGHTTRLRYYHRDYAPVRKTRPGLHVRVAELEAKVAALEAALARVLP